MICNVVVAALIASACLGVSDDDKALAVFPNDKLPAPFALHGQTPNVTVELDPAAPEGGKGSIKVTLSGGPISELLLFDAKLSGVEDCVLWYEATVKCEGMTNQACLEMWVAFPDGNSYFSRGLDQVFTGTQDWQRRRIPFFLKKGESPTSVAMGVRFEGTGAVWLSNARLVKESRRWFSDPGTRGAVMGIVCGTYGAVMGIWGSIVGYLVSRGKGRRFVMVTGTCFLAVGILAVLAGFFCLLGRFHWDIWFYLLLMGGIDIVLLGVILPAKMRMYKQVEAQRLQAQDLAANL